MKSTIPSEAQEQAVIFRWTELAAARMPEVKLLFAIPNGGSRHQIEAVHLKEQGVKAGVPDMCLPVPRGGYHGLWIELKRTQGGRLRQEQADWLHALQAQGYCALVCKGADSAIKLIYKYLKGEMINGKSV